MGIEAKSFNSSQRNEFVRDLCTLIATKTIYKTEAERQLIAEKIIQTFPFLKDPPIGNNSNEWVSDLNCKYITIYIYRSTAFHIAQKHICCQSHIIWLLSGFHCSSVSACADLS